MASRLLRDITAPLALPYATPNPFSLPRLRDKPQSQRQRNQEGQTEEEWGLPPPHCQPPAPTPQGWA